MTNEEIQQIVERLRVVAFLSQREASKLIEETLSTCCSEEGDW